MREEHAEADARGASAQKAVFARDATGLVREISPLMASVFNFANAPVGLVIVFSPIVGFGYFSGGSSLLGILPALVGSVPRPSELCVPKSLDAEIEGFRVNDRHSELAFGRDRVRPLGPPAATFPDRAILLSLGSKTESSRAKT